MPTQTTGYTIRPLQQEEIPKLLELCKAEGRHMGKSEEVQSWLLFDPNGFYVAATDEGEILGSCVGIRLSKTHGYIGMYVVRQDVRGIGIGKMIWNAAIEHLESRNKGLSAVSALFHTYRDKAGFSQVADWTVDLYKLEKLPKMFRSFGQEQKLNGFFQLRFNKRHSKYAVFPGSKLKTVPYDESLLSDVIAYDRRLHSYDRSKIVTLTLNEKSCRTRVALLGDTVVGYGCVKPNLQDMWMVSPLYADSDYVAKMLMSDLIGSLSTLELDEGVVLKCPSNNYLAKNLLKTLGFERQTYSLRRCYTKYVFEIPAQFIYALHTSVFCTE